MESLEHRGPNVLHIINNTSLTKFVLQVSDVGSLIWKCRGIRMQARPVRRIPSTDACQGDTRLAGY
eukprot:12230585-Karenia_brevis.AAC.1